MSDALARLASLVPPPSRPKHASGDRDAARAAIGWPVPDHVFEVIELYGEVAWMGWMLLCSPFAEAGVSSLADRAYDLEQVAPGKRTLLAPR